MTLNTPPSTFLLPYPTNIPLTFSLTKQLRDRDTFLASIFYNSLHTKQIDDGDVSLNC